MRRFLLLALALCFVTCHWKARAATNGPDPVPSIQQYSAVDVLYTAMRMTTVMGSEGGEIAIQICHDPKAMEMKLRGSSEDARRIAVQIAGTNLDYRLRDKLRGVIQEVAMSPEVLSRRGADRADTFARMVIDHPQTRVLLNELIPVMEWLGRYALGDVRMIRDIQMNPTGKDCQGNEWPDTVCVTWHEDPGDGSGPSCYGDPTNCTKWIIKKPAWPFEPIIAW